MNNKIVPHEQKEISNKDYLKLKSAFLKKYGSEKGSRVLKAYLYKNNFKVKKPSRLKVLLGLDK